MTTGRQEDVMEERRSGAGGREKGLGKEDGKGKAGGWDGGIKKKHRDMSAYADGRRGWQTKTR